MPQAARLNDQYIASQGIGTITGAARTVLIGYEPAARAGDWLETAGNMILEGAFNVQIEGWPAARVGDPTGNPGVITTGCPTVLIGTSAQIDVMRRAAARGKPFCQDCEEARRDAQLRDDERATEEARRDAQLRDDERGTGEHKTEEPETDAYEGEKTEEPATEKTKA